MKYVLVKNDRYIRPIIEVHQANWFYGIFGPTEFSQKTSGYDETDAIESLNRLLKAKRTVVKEIEIP